MSGETTYNIECLFLLIVKKKSIKGQRKVNGNSTKDYLVSACKKEQLAKANCSCKKIGER